MRIQSSVVVNRPIDEVWAFRTDFFNLPRLSGMTLGMRTTTPGPVGVGTTLQGRVVILGFETQVSGVISEWDPPHALTVALVRGAGVRSGSLRQTYGTAADGTTVVNMGEVELGPILKLLWPIVAPYLRRRTHAADQKMKRLLEAREASV